MRRSTLVLVVLFAALGALYWYMQKPGNLIRQALATSTPTVQPQSDLLGPEQGPVSQISVQRTDGKAVTLKKAGGIWLVTTDDEVPANQETSAMVAQSVLALRVIAKLENAPDLAAIGLDNPAYTVTLTLVDGSPYAFKIGNVAATGSGYYIQANDGSIAVVDKYTLDTLTNLVVEPPFLQTPTPPPVSVITPEGTAAFEATSTATP